MGSSRLVSITIVIPNWNGKRFLDTSLDSLRRQTFKDFETIVVDNGSTDGSVNFIREKYPEVKLIKFSKNRGFSAAVNEGIRHSNSKYVALLNNDTECDSKWLAELFKTAESADGKIGSFSSKMISFYDRNRIDGVGISVDKLGGALQIGYLESDNGQFDSSFQVFGPVGGAALYRREMLTKIGLFDEDFFAYYEDVDLAWRAKVQGWDSIYVPTAIVYHIHTGTNLNPNFIDYLLDRNGVYYVIKNAQTDVLIRFIARKIAGDGFRIVKFLSRREWDTFLSLLKCRMDILVHLPKMLKKRVKIQGSRVKSDYEILSVNRGHS